MANRSYLYSLSNQPESWADRPESIQDLSEWPYDVPFSFRVLLSGNPRLCASLITDGFEDDPEDQPTLIHAINGEFEPGFARLQRFLDIVRTLSADAPRLLSAIDETLTFLGQHRERYLQLETIELDTMQYEEEEDLKGCVEAEMELCMNVGAAIDALPEDTAEAARLLLSAANGEQQDSPLGAFDGLRFDDDFDSTRDGATDYPLGLYWADVLYFSLLNRKEFEEAMNSPE